MRLAWSAASLMLLAGCHPAVTLAVTESDAPVFAVRQADGTACLRTLGVYRISDGQLAWRVGQQEASACASRMRYGAVPGGYVQIGPARPLVAGARYRVAVTGPGYNEAAVFTAAAVRPPS